MPFEAHPLFEAPAENTKIWRYIDFTKFVSLLDVRSLFFVSADKLAQLDPFEGRFTNLDAASEANFLKLRYSNLPPEEWEKFGYKSEKELTFMQELHRESEPLRSQFDQGSIFINSWHWGEDESDAMWKLYITGNNGIALRSTYKKLRESFEKSPERVFIGKVKYLDYNASRIPKSDTFSPFLHKKTCYQHESELRAVVWDLEQIDRSHVNAPGNRTVTLKNPDLTGILVKSDIESLVEELYISPRAEKWFHDLVRSVAEKYGFKFAIKQSDIYSIPKYN